MSPKNAAILASPHPRGHIMYPYTDPHLVAEAVCLYASAGLRNGEGVVLVMRKAHRDPIDKRLTAEGFDTEQLQRTGQLVYAIAETLLAAFMVDGMPDAALFKSLIGPMIERARASTPPNRRPALVRAFGEMISILWVNNVAAARRLEQLWDEVIQTYSISLMCTYAMSDNTSSTLAPELVNCHSHHIAGRES